MNDAFSPRESLELIQSMIDKTKSGMSENRPYFLVWGWISFIAIIGQFILKVVFLYEHHYAVWLLTFVGLFVTVSYNRKGRRPMVRTWVGDSMSHLWTGIGISFGILTFLFTQLPSGFLYCYPFYILFYGLGTFISGRILQFRPLVIGGIINWLLAIGAAFVSFDYQMLFAAAAIGTSYIIPGHLIQPSKNKS